MIEAKNALKQGEVQSGGKVSVFRDKNTTKCSGEE